MQKFLLILFLTGCSSSVTVYGHGDSGIEGDALAGSGGTSGAAGDPGTGGSASEAGSSTGGSSGVTGTGGSGSVGAGGQTCETREETCRRVSGNIPPDDGACGTTKNNCNEDVDCGHCSFFANCVYNKCSVLCTYTPSTSDCKLGLKYWYQCYGQSIDNQFGCQAQKYPDTGLNYCCQQPS